MSFIKMSAWSRALLCKENLLEVNFLINGFNKVFCAKFVLQFVHFTINHIYVMFSIPYKKNIFSIYVLLLKIEEKRTPQKRRERKGDVANKSVISKMILRRLLQAYIRFRLLYEAACKGQETACNKTCNYINFLIRNWHRNRSQTYQ